MLFSTMYELVPVKRTVATPLENWKAMPPPDWSGTQKPVGSVSTV